MILAIVKQQLRQIRNISRFRFAIAGLLSIITKYKNNLKSRAHKECMAKIGRYVERALDRLTVTTMLLCRDSALKVLARKARSGGSSFLFACSQGVFRAYRNFCGALDWFSLSVGGVGVSRGGVEFVPVDAGPVCGRDAVVRFGRRCLFALPQGVGDE